MKNLILLFGILILSFPNIANSKPSPENNAKAIAALKITSELLKEEQKRWETIHKNPVTDQWKVTQDNANIYVDVTIDTGVKNIINDQPIKRKYTLIPKEYSLVRPFDIMVGANLIAPIGIRPTIGLGYAPDWSYGFGATVNTTFLSINAGVYYKTPKLPYMFFQVFAGADFYGKTDIGFGVGLRI